MFNFFKKRIAGLTQAAQSSEAKERRFSTYRGFLRSIDGGVVLLLAWPLLLLLVDSSWLFSYALTIFIDPWVYFGYFLDLRQHSHAFAGAYYGSRLPWTLPGWLAYRLFSPLIAAYILHLAFYYAAIVSFYLILKDTVDRRSALLASILLGCHSFFLRAIGWDYVDGAGITYLLLALLMLTWAAKSRRCSLWLGCAGVFYGCLIHTQLFLASFTPLIALYYLFANREHRQHSLGLSFVFFTIGSASLTSVLSIINTCWLDGQSSLFLSSFRLAAGLVTRGNKWRASSYSWVTQAGWLLFPALIFLGSVFFLLLSRRMRSVPHRRFVFFYQVYFILNVLTLGAWEVLRQPVLEYFYYVSYLLPSMFLAIGAQFAVVAGRLTSRRFHVLVGSVVVISLTAYLCPLDSRLANQLESHVFLPFLIGAAGLVGLAVRRLYSVEIGVLLISIAFAMLNMTTGTRTWTRNSDSSAPKDSFLVVAESVRTIQAMDPTSTSLFWYNFRAPLGSVSRAVVSCYLWGWRLVSEDFPVLEGDYQQPALHSRMFILSNDKDALEEANRSLAGRGFRANVLNEKTIQQGPISYRIIFVEVQDRPKRE
jgi:hypothetical protein